MKKTCNLIIQNFFNFSYKPSIQFIYAARKLNSNGSIPQNKPLEVKQEEVKQENIESQPTLKITETVQFIPSIIEQYKISLSQNEIDIINLCGPLVGFEQPKKDIDKNKKKK